MSSCSPGSAASRLTCAESSPASASESTKPGSAQRLEGKLAGLVTASIVPPPQAVRVPIVADYQRDRAEFGEKIDSYTALEGYIVARVMVEGLRRAGKTLTRDSFIAGLESIGSTRFGDFPIEYGPAREPWGVRRFYVRDPFGRLVNILAHLD